MSDWDALIQAIAVRCPERIIELHIKTIGSEFCHAELWEQNADGRGGRRIAEANGPTGWVIDALGLAL